MNDLTTELLSGLIDEPWEPPTKVRSRPARVGMDSMSIDDRRKYNRQKQAQRRERIAIAKTGGVTLYDFQSAREALADAALMLLAADVPGADKIRAVLAKIFHSQPGAVMTIEIHARAGQFKPKLFKLK